MRSYRHFSRVRDLRFLKDATHFIQMEIQLTPGSGWPRSVFFLRVETAAVSGFLEQQQQRTELVHIPAQDARYRINGSDFKSQRFRSFVLGPARPTAAATCQTSSINCLQQALHNPRFRMISIKY